MNKTMFFAVIVAALLAPGVAGANHEVPDPSPHRDFVLDRAGNNAPVETSWPVWLHLDRDNGTWRMDCTSPSGSPSNESCPMILDGSLDLDPHYGPLSDPGCSLPAGHSGTGELRSHGKQLLPPTGPEWRYEGAQLSDVLFPRIPSATSSPIRPVVVHLEGQWSDTHGRADRLEAVLHGVSGAGSDPCAPIAHVLLRGHVWLVGVVR